MRSLLQKTFENEFNESGYKELILNLFNRFDFSKGHTLRHQFTEAEKQALNDFIYLGTYEDSQNKKLDVLITELKSGSKVERARSLQRNLIGKYLKSNLKDSALVAFYSKDNPDWRLSFVKMDYRLDEKGVKTEIGTPPKRYSFLVGETEPSHTAQKQLLPLLDDKKIPLVDEIEKSFSIEKVTKEFYTEIARKFTELVGGERKTGSKKIVESGCLRLPSTDDDTVEKEFAVRLIGRLLFCWFLKKKKSEAGIPLLKDAIISSIAVQQEPDYYHRYLERLFFQVLNTPHEKRPKEASHGIWPNVPFLNGGLFEPHLKDFYDVDALWNSTHQNTLKVPDKWLKELFEIFELFNFTIDESTTIDVDISVDPEMLGRIFENLLAEINPATGETARKSTGSYYTPRPIVEYMVDESLKQYLLTQVSAGKDVIPVKTGIQNDEKLDSCLRRNDGNEILSYKDKISKLLSYSDEPVDLTESEEDSIIDALDRVKIIDPACGSGAFPMGILHKMLLILQKIDPESKKWLTRKLARIDNKLLRKELESKLKSENWDYVHKLGIIQNSIYGVDIQPIAVEISKLRFFLSLIVDEKIDEGKPNRGIVPLPNLEFKFVAANSLIGLPLTSSLSQMELFEARAYINKLKELRDAYFTSYGEEKNKIEKEFQQIQNKMFEYARKEMVTHKKTLETQTLKLSQWNPFSDEASSWFDPEWMFGVKDGFDVVIANPPYIDSEMMVKTDPEFRDLLSKHFKTAKGNWDLYVIFYELGYNILKSKGILTYITPNKWLSIGYGKELRKFINTDFYKLCNCSKINVFEAGNSPIISFLKKDNDDEVLYLYEFNTNNVPEIIGTAENRLLTSDNWGIFLSANIKLLLKIMSTKNRLKEFVNVKNPFSTSEAYELCDLIINSHKESTSYFKLINTGTIDPYVSLWGIKMTSYLKGKYLYPVIEKNKFKKIFSRRFVQATSPKIIITGMRYFECFYDEQGNYIAGKSTIILKDFNNDANPKYLLSLLNSKLISFYIKQSYSALGIDGGINFSAEIIEQLPIPKTTPTQQQPFITLVDQILSAKQNPPSPPFVKGGNNTNSPLERGQGVCNDTSALEKQIDEMVYKLYGLTPEEIAIIEGGKK